MTPAERDLLPPEFGRWPRKVQRQYIQELHALYFPVLHWWEKPASADVPFEAARAARAAALHMVLGELDHPGTVVPQSDSERDLLLVAVVELAVCYARLLEGRPRS